MSNKTIIALSAIALLGSVSAASAYEDPSNRIGDRYAHLEMTYAPVATKATGNRMLIRPAATRTQTVAEVPENRLGDRYAFLVTGYAPATSNYSARATRPLPILMSDETPEHKLGDRYQFLDHGYAQISSVRYKKKV